MLIIRAYLKYHIKYLSQAHMILTTREDPGGKVT